jgi:hypothetical protein
MKASDSPNASAKTTGTAQASLVRTNSTTCCAAAEKSIEVGLIALPFVSNPAARGTPVR